MLTKTTLVLAAVLTLGAGSLAQAASENDGGNETGGYVLPGSTAGVNPAYHPLWFSHRAQAGTYSGAGSAYGFVPPTTHHKHRSQR